MDVVGLAPTGVVCRTNARLTRATILDDPTRGCVFCYSVELAVDAAQKARKPMGS